MGNKKWVFFVYSDLGQLNSSVWFILLWSISQFFEEIGYGHLPSSKGTGKDIYPKLVLISFNTHWYFRKSIWQNLQKSSAGSFLKPLWSWVMHHIGTGLAWASLYSAGAEMWIQVPFPSPCSKGTSSVDWGKKLELYLQCQFESYLCFLPFCCWIL